MLKIPVSRTHRTVEPRRYENSNGGDSLRMNIEETDYFRLGISEAVKDRAGLEIDMFRQFNDGLHADGPIMFLVSRRHPETIIELASNGANGSVTNHGERGLDVHAGHITGVRFALPVDALIHHPHAHDGVILNQRLLHGHCGPYLHRAARHQLACHPLVELPNRHHQAVMFPEKLRRVGKFERVVIHRQHPAEGFDGGVGGAQSK